MQKHGSLLILLLLLASTSHAALIVVNSNQDTVSIDGNCTLREALTAANFDIAFDQCSAGQGDDLIWLLLNVTNDAVQLDTTLPIIDGVTIQGPGADRLVLVPATGNTNHIFQINTDRDVVLQRFRIGGAQSSAIDVVEVDDLTIDNMRFINNDAGNSEHGGALKVNPAPGGIDFSENRTILINNSTFEGNQAVSGGAIYINEDYILAVENSLFQNNSITQNQGSAIYKITSDLSFVSRDADTIINTDFLNHGTALNIKSLLSLNQQKFIIDRSSFIENGDTPLSASSGLGVVKNSLFTGNTAEFAVLSYFDTGELTVMFSTFFENNKAIGATQGATVYVTGNIFDADGCDENISATPGAVLSLGYNIEHNNFGTLSCTSDPSDIPDTDPLLLPLGTYGGTRLIAPPSPISLAVDTAAAGCDDNDLSGEGRPRNGDASGFAACDMGAVERPDALNLSVAHSGNGSGSIYINDLNLGCETPVPCDWPLEQGGVFNLTAPAIPGSTFIQWGGACNGNAGCQITMTNAQNVTAEFALVPNPVTLTVNKDYASAGLEAMITSNPAGIDCGNTCLGNYIEGDQVVLLAAPNLGTLVSAWTGCDTISPDGLTCTVGLNSNSIITVFLEADENLIFTSGFEN